MAYYSNKMAEWAWTLTKTEISTDAPPKTTWKPIIHTKLCEPIVTLDLPAVCDGTKWTTASGKEYPIPADNPDYKPPCALADIIVNAYNGNIAREEVCAHYRNEMLLVANDLENDGKKYHADWIRKAVAVCDEKLEDTKPSEAALDALVEAATGLD